MKNATATATANAFEQIRSHADLIKSGQHKVKPGQELSFSPAASVGDTIAQGDLYIMVADKMPAEYELVEANVANLQLVPGNTQGARHCLDSFDGVTMYRPKTWTEEDLRGPYLQLTKDRTVLHPTHGPVNLIAGMNYLCGYQKEYDTQERKERRNRD